MLAKKKGKDIQEKEYLISSRITFKLWYSVLPRQMLKYSEGKMTIRLSEFLIYGKLIWYILRPTREI